MDIDWASFSVGFGAGFGTAITIVAAYCASMILYVGREDPEEECAD